VKEQSLLFNCQVLKINSGSNPINHTNPINHGSDNCDIIKAHGGEIIVETKEKEGTTFILKIPTA
jgi:light-regulated signal transduction histidine kinase (bacteriophytochrome)